MIVKQIIPADAYRTRKAFQKDGERFLNISEFFYDTIQGEGINIGQPAAFLRLKGCTLRCVFCDTKEVWRFGSSYTFHELFELMEQTNVIRKFKDGQHLVLTGGSPLIQQDQLFAFYEEFDDRYGFVPYTEIENEGVLLPGKLTMYIDCWNNSPKLVNSGMSASSRYHPKILKALSKLDNSWFKFVITNENEWVEIEHFYLKTNLIQKDQIILMPEGATRIELAEHAPFVLEMAIKHGVRYTTREHIVLWDRKTGC